LLAGGAADGLFFALPTMATSNAMYARLGALHRRFFTPESEPSCVLAHSARELNETFRDAVASAPDFSGDYPHGEPSNAAACNRWLADSRKKALLADVGVGTIDQVLMGVLPFRHQSLRLLGLAGKVLIIDEVHAYDMYMQRLLETLLEYHAGQGGSAIVLTATLAQSMRAALTAAWQRGCQAPKEIPEQEAFPLFTAVSPQGVLAEQPLSSPKAAERSVAIEWLAGEETAIETILAAANRGEAVAWVRNTVDDAIRAYEAIREQLSEPDCCMLFHARFAMVDRQRIEQAVLARFGKHSTRAQRRGCVLIATQVFQESLDCDVDRLLSDIAPIDALIQRAGRLQRHDRGQRVAAPTLHVLAPAWNEAPDAQWLRRFLPGSHAVYQGAELCWLTQRVLREKGGIHLPRDARTLIESVYGDAAEDALPQGLLSARSERQGQAMAAGSMAMFNALDLAAGYGGQLERWQPEQEIGTRLSDEPSCNVVLLRAAESSLELWAGNIDHAAMLSQVRLRASQAAKLASLSSTREAEWEWLQQRHRSLVFATPWVVADDQANQYDATYGLRLRKSES
ncbi:MAG TPA: CRISPR-associated helicase Cas3', partial [Salinisphaeraceae bacterium]|nr:CRISPR-associated helicase Cas3' [Salinisphaeraceae bacterium]